MKKKLAEDKKLLAPFRQLQKGTFFDKKSAFGQAFQNKVAGQPFRGRGRGWGVPSTFKSWGQQPASENPGQSIS